MIRPSRRISSRIGAALLAGLLVLLIGGWVAVIPADAAQSCPSPTDGDVFQGPDERVYLFTNGTLRAIPDLETLRALGFDPNGVDLIREACFRVMRFGDPMPSVGPGGQRGTSASATTPAATRDPAAPAVTLDVNDPSPARRTTIRLTARTDAPDGGGLTLSIHRVSGEGGTGASGLVTTCANTTTCTVEVWEDEAATWTYVATLYRCQAPGVCVAVQESTPVSVAWQ